ncbi:ssl1498 family light-harvesting-like protein [Synechococcus sp. RSCCF101]|uniref:photosystem II assembly protein Psb34 n=1 Tax=Synechococcus sp. RSCCF101 TaxID=2511069 RepID=UPI0012477425|nr:ssl1498 family light-harvesting-like protein [Synechococcus sp. RSCCF101]QEY32545.1 ssl1498 family light-harvesting-like protein [Synechococcus sp. RSCCF101]
MQVTEEDGGRLNAFAKEPRMEVEQPDAQSRASGRVVLVAGALVVALMVALAFGVS